MAGHFLLAHGIVHNGGMVDRDATTLTPPPPAEQDPEAKHKALVNELAEHPDPRVRILAHISTRQFELSERMTSMQQSIDQGFEGLKSKMNEGFRDLRDKVAALDEGFTDVEDRTTALEKERGHLNGSSSTTQ